METYVQPGDTMNFTAPVGGFTVDTPKLVGSLLVIPTVTGAEGVTVACNVKGVYSGLSKVSAQAWTEGQKVYWDAANTRFTTVATDGVLAGVAAAVAANPSSTGTVRLNAVPSDVSEGPQGTIVTLTDSTGGSGTHDDTLADGLTATAPGAITNYTAHAAGAVAVTSNAATDLDTTAAALATLENEVTALTAVVAALVTDMGVQNQNDSDLAQKIIEIRTALINFGVIAAA